MIMKPTFYVALCTSGSVLFKKQLLGKALLEKRGKNWKPKQARKAVASYINIHAENKYS
jgi:hypothetical protein